MTADTVGGVWTYALELARALGTCGIRVDLASMGGEATPAQRADAAAIPNLELHESTFKLEWMADPWADVEQAGRWLQDLAVKTRPDIIHFNNYAHASLEWPAPTLVVGHSCVYSWFSAVRGEAPADAEWAQYHASISRGLHAADYVTAPTRAILGELHRWYGWFERRSVIYNGCRAGDFPPLDKQPFVLAAGRIWDEAKNVAAVARVARYLPWEVRVAGEAQHPDGGAVDFPGVKTLGRLNRHELADHYGRASIFCAPARYEPFGLCALEAGLAGCALVLGDIPSLREVWSGAALYVDPNDEALLERVLNRLIEDAELRDEMSHRARKRAAFYTVERMADGYNQLYASLLSVAVPPARRPRPRSLRPVQLRKSSSSTIRSSPTGTTVTRISCVAWLRNSSPAATKCASSSRPMVGAAAICSTSMAKRRSGSFTASIHSYRARCTNSMSSTLTRRCGMPTSSSYTNGTAMGSCGRSGRIDAVTIITGCSSTIRIIVRSPTPNR